MTISLPQAISRKYNATNHKVTFHKSYFFIEKFDVFFWGIHFLLKLSFFFFFFLGYSDIELSVCKQLLGMIGP